MEQVKKKKDFLCHATFAGSARERGCVSGFNLTPCRRRFVVRRPSRRAVSMK
jgi:hypothetical protein